jgi:hypothetical protein
VGGGGLFADSSEESFVGLDEGDDGFSVVFGDVLGFVACKFSPADSEMADGVRLFVGVLRFALFNWIKGAIL